MTALKNAAFETLEIRHYTLHPNERDTLIDIFEREFIESQEAVGMVPIGHFRDLDDPDSFVWFRGFPSYESRPLSLEAFYVHGAAWKANRDAANATMIDSDDVLMMRSARPGSGFRLEELERPALGAAIPQTFVALSTAAVPESKYEPFTESFEREHLAHLSACAKSVAYFVTEPRANTFPRLPVREGEPTFAVVGACPDLASLVQWSALLAGTGFTTARLQPASRSLFR